MHTKDSITKWRGGKKILNFDKHSEISDWFLITSHMLLEICLIDYVIPLFLRGILVYRISKTIYGLLPLQSRS